MKLPLSPKTLFDHAPVGMAVLDRQGKVVSANSAMGEFLGCAASATIGLRLVTAFTFPAAAAREAELFLELVDGKRSRYQLEKRYRRPDGKVVWGSVNVTMLPDERGTPTEFVFCTIEDVTARLAGMARRQRETKLDAMARLAAEILQRLNHLLVATLGSSQLTLADASEARYRDLAETVRDTIERTLAVNRQLVEFCSRQVSSLDVVDLNAILVRMQPRLRGLLGNDVELVMALTPKSPHVKADAGRLEKAIWLMATNAKEAMPSGGRLTLATGLALVDEGVEKSTSYVTLSISDTGHGMDAKALERLFEPFFSTKERGRAAGLSLATVHGMVRQYGGFLDVASEPGFGTTFTFHLPRTSDTVPELTMPSGGDTVHDGETILLIEEDDAVRTRFRAMLRGAGFNVLEARYVGEGLLLCLRHGRAIDVVVSEVDWQLLPPHELMEQVATVRPRTRFAFITDGIGEAPALAGVATVVRSASADTLVRALRAAASWPSEMASRKPS